MKVTLKGRNIPRNKVGDPCFVVLGNREREPILDGLTPRVIDVFTDEEIVELVNRCLYQLEYQARAHVKRNAEQRALLKPTKAALKIVHPGVAWIKATDKQIADAMVYASEHPDVGKEDTDVDD